MFLFVLCLKKKHNLKWSISQDILYSEEGGRVRNGAGEDESDSEDGWKAAFYSQPNSNCVYIDYNKGINPNP